MEEACRKHHSRIMIMRHLKQMAHLRLKTPMHSIKYISCPLPTRRKPTRLCTCRFSPIFPKNFLEILKSSVVCEEKSARICNAQKPKFLLMKTAAFSVFLLCYPVLSQFASCLPQSHLTKNIHLAYFFMRFVQNKRYT